jgi:hypothetical protein
LVGTQRRKQVIYFGSQRSSTRYHSFTRAFFAAEQCFSAIPNAPPRILNALSAFYSRIG